MRVSRALEKVVAVDPTLHLCPGADCSFVVAWVSVEMDGVPQIDCPQCNVQYCLVCGATPYHDGRTCEEHKQYTKDPHSVEEAATAAYLAQAKIRTCPNCSTPLVKTYGCDKMQCRCGYRFCYQCGAPNAQCDCTPARHGFINQDTGHAEFDNLKGKEAATRHVQQQYRRL